MRHTLTIATLLLMTTACGNDGAQSRVAASAAQTQPSPEPAAPADPPASTPVASPAPTTHGLASSLHGSRVYQAPHFDADSLRRIDALAHPVTLDFLPGGDIAPAMPSAKERQRLTKEAEARYSAEFGSMDRGPHVSPSQVDLVLRVTNTNSEDVHVKMAGDDGVTRMLLTGPGARHMYAGGDLTEIYVCGKWVTIAPGGHVDIAVKSLRYGDRPHDLGAVWTTPGSYQLVMGLDTVMTTGPVPDDCSARGRTRVALVTPPMSIDVR